MTQRFLPVYTPTLTDIKYNSIENYAAIQSACRKVGHLGTEEDLLDLIIADNKILETRGFTKEDIYQTHHNMYLLFSNINADSKTTHEHGNHAKELMEKMPEGFGSDWYSVSQITNEITMNNNDYRITCITWSRSEICPIECFYSDEDHSLERGYKDWLISNITTGDKIWIPDLIPFQVGMFGFFQGLESKYRIDPEKYMNVMGMVAGTDALSDEAVSDSTPVYRSLANSPYYTNYVDDCSRAVKPIMYLRHYHWGMRDQETADLVNKGLIHNSAGYTNSDTDGNITYEIVDKCKILDNETVILEGLRVLCKDYSIPNNPNECTYLAVKFNEEYLKNANYKTIRIFDKELSINGLMIESYNKYIQSNPDNFAIFKLIGTNDIKLDDSNKARKDSSCILM